MRDVETERKPLLKGVLPCGLFCPASTQPVLRRSFVKSVQSGFFSRVFSGQGAIRIPERFLFRLRRRSETQINAGCGKSGFLFGNGLQQIFLDAGAPIYGLQRFQRLFGLRVYRLGFVNIRILVARLNR
ncbi:hypothetical protein FMN50_20275 [Rhodobacterales bacterium]|nr:hypothetical protein FMN50_20275 [Rhodobacterales bacterium]